jgi:hypothetical protein
MAALRYMSGRELATRRDERVQKLEWIAQQVTTGELVIRQATAEERARYGIPVDPEAHANSGERRTRGRRRVAASASRPVVDDAAPRGAAQLAGDLAA